MARIFSIYFTFENVHYNAIVSVRTTHFYTEYTLNNFNADLQDMLPGNKIVSSAPDEFVFLNATHEHSTPLMKEIIRAVSEHLLATKA